MNNLLKNITKLVFGILLINIIIFIRGEHASAATLAVNNTCTLNKAIAAINSASDSTDCIKTGSAYGTSDTINLPSGTITLTADTTVLQKPVTVAGAGKTSTTIDANNKLGINISLLTPYSGDATVRDLKITGAKNFGLSINETSTVTIQNLEVTDSEIGVRVDHTKTTTISNVSIHDNIRTSTDTEEPAGLSVSLRALNSGDQTILNINNSEIKNNKSLISAKGNSGLLVGLKEDATNGGNAGLFTVNTHNVTITGNEAAQQSGLSVVSAFGPLSPVSTALHIDATTIANNKSATSVVVADGSAQLPLVAGVYLSMKLNDQQNFTNVTVANNTVIVPSGDGRKPLAGFFGILSYLGSSIKITNTTVVGNNLTQPNDTFKYSAFAVLKANIQNTPPYALIDVYNGSTAENVLVAQNLTNGSVLNCLGTFDKAVYGLTGIINVTPENIAHNLSDDQTCKDYTYSSNLYSTIDHNVADNGGPVPTIKLLPGSPAINGGGQVLGISTDARGVVREGYYSIGAYQGVLAATTTTPNNLLGNTGVKKISVFVLAGVIIASLTYVFLDYRRHRKPLIEADPSIKYSFAHHIKVVTLPLFRYRLQIQFKKQDDDGLFRKF